MTLQLDSPCPGRLGAVGQDSAGRAAFAKLVYRTEQPRSPDAALHRHGWLALRLGMP